MKRHADLKSVFSRTLDQSRFKAESRESVEHWFELYNATVEKHGIAFGDRYSMGETGFLHGIIASSPVIIPKGCKTTTVQQHGSRDWTTTIECVSSSGRRCPPMIIFKAARLCYVLRTLFCDREVGKLILRGWSEGWTRG